MVTVLWGAPRPSDWGRLYRNDRRVIRGHKSTMHQEPLIHLYAVVDHEPRTRKHPRENESRGWKPCRKMAITGGLKWLVLRVNPCVSTPSYKPEAQMMARGNSSCRLTSLREGSAKAVYEERNIHKVRGHLVLLRLSREDPH